VDVRKKSGNGTQDWKKLPYDEIAQMLVRQTIPDVQDLTLNKLGAETSSLHFVKQLGDLVVYRYVPHHSFDLRFAFSEEMSRVNAAGAWLQSWRYRVDEAEVASWSHEFARLYEQIHSLNFAIEGARLKAILDLRERNEKTACAELAALMQSLLIARAQGIRWLRGLVANDAIPTATGTGRNAQANLISSQRAWYLHHGAHPSGSAVFANAAAECSGGFIPALAA
jgi:hypothetical protein